MSEWRDMVKLWLRERRNNLRADATRCERAYTKEPMLSMCLRVARAYRDASDVIGSALREMDSNPAGSQASVRASASTDSGGGEGRQPAPAGEGIRSPATHPCFLGGQPCGDDPYERCRDCPFGGLPREFPGGVASR